MSRATLALMLVVGMLGVCACERSKEISMDKTEGVSNGAASDELEARRSSVELKRDAFESELAEHSDVAYAMPVRSVPDWFFRPSTELRQFLPNGKPYEWEAQFDCTNGRIPACNLNYEVKMSDVEDTDEVYVRASGLEKLGFRVVDERPPSLKAVRPEPRAPSVETVYVNRPDEGDIWMSATLREPVHPEVARMLAQPRFEVPTGFAVEFLSIPNSITVSKPAYDDRVEYVATFDLSETQRADVESFLESHDFRMVSKSAVEANTSIWKHPSGWRVSLEGDESVYQRFLVYFTASGHVSGPED